MNNPTIWAIPWQGDVRVIYYWKDLLEAAGINNIDQAFQTDAALVETLKKLQQNGFAAPLAINTQATSQVLHEAAHWLWAAGGDFVSPDGKRVVFNDPQALEGFKNYFSLSPYVPEQSLVKTPLDFFRERTSPIHLSGLWVPSAIADADLQAQLGVAKLPGVAYTGGTSLVVWQYTTKAQPAFELIRFLSSQPMISNGPHYNQLPTRREALDAPMTQKDAFNQTYLQAFQAGRTFPTLRLWGSIEDRLIPVLANLWQEILSDQPQDLEVCLHKHLDPLATRLNLILGN
jgi:multiple sugar transport system substrate-binding protein